jgi:hypothetical protein
MKTEPWCCDCAARHPEHELLLCDLVNGHEGPHRSLTQYLPRDLEQEYITWYTKEPHV